MTFDAPVVVRSIRVETGRPDGSDLLAQGELEVAEDGTTFTCAAELDPKGVAQDDLGGRTLRAIRLKVAGDTGHALVVRELAIDSDLVRPFAHPVEFAVAVRDAPDLEAWTEATARLCEQWYDALNAELASDGFVPTDRIGLTIEAQLPRGRGGRRRPDHRLGQLLRGASRRPGSDDSRDRPHHPELQDSH